MRRFRAYWPEEDERHRLKLDDDGYAARHAVFRGREPVVAARLDEMMGLPQERRSRASVTGLPPVHEVHNGTPLAEEGRLGVAGSLDLSSPGRMNVGERAVIELDDHVV